jgi:glutamine amidotransferase PdxT
LSTDERFFQGLDGLIIPGGESTTISKIAERSGLVIEFYLVEIHKKLKPIRGQILQYLQT